MLALLAANVLAMNTNQTSGDSSRDEVDSVTGQEILARNSPAGASAPTIYLPTRANREVTQKAREFGEVRPGARGEQAVQLSLTLNDGPYTPAALDTIPSSARPSATESSSVARAQRSTTCARRRLATTG